MNTSQHNDGALPRRELLKRSFMTAGAVAGLATTARAKSSGVIGANERIRMGVIGCGGLALGHHIPKLVRLSQDGQTNVELAALCEIYDLRKKIALEKAPDAEMIHDYREMLDRKDIHGVVIVTPDHWHAKMAIDAMEAGKDVHVEKPMTLYWEEARDVYETATRLKRVVQVGAEGTSKDLFWKAREVIAQQRLGKVVWATGGVYRNAPGGDWNYPINPECTPKTLDWDRWLGPAPKRPFEPERFFRYRKYWDYSGGLAHDLISHILSALQIAIGPEFPSRVSAAGGIYCHPDRETPDTFHMMVEYPSNYVATLFSTQTTDEGIEMAIRGEKATLHFGRGKHGERIGRVEPESPYADEIEPFEIPSEPRPDHDVNFIECMRTREAPHCDALTGYKIMVALGLAVRSWREGRMFTFDPEKQQIVE